METTRLEKFKNFVNDLPIPDRGDFNEFFKGPFKPKVKDERGNYVMDEEDTSDFDVMEEKINMTVYSTESLQKTYNLIAEVTGEPFTTVTTDFDVELDEKFERMRQQIEETVYKEVAQFMIVTEFRDNGTIQDLLDNAKQKSTHVHDFIMDMDLASFKDVCTKGNYPARKLTYL